MKKNSAAKYMQIAGGFRNEDGNCKPYYNPV